MIGAFITFILGAMQGFVDGDAVTYKKQVRDIAQEAVGRIRVEFGFGDKANTTYAHFEYAFPYKGIGKGLAIAQQYTTRKEGMVRNALFKLISSNSWPAS